MTRRRAWMLVSGLLIAAAVVVDLRTPAAIRLGIGSDTLVINGTHPVLLGVRAANRFNWPIWRPQLKYSGLPSTLAHAERGAVTCTGGNGDALLTIAHRHVEHQVFVRCRPIAGFSFFGQEIDPLEVAGPPRELAFAPFGRDHKAIALLRGTAAIHDSSIAILKDGMIYPRRIGSTYIEATFSGGARTTIPVSVQRTAVDTTLRLSGGELRLWRLPAGYYELRLDVSDTLQTGPVIAVGATASNCAPGRNGRQDYYCLTTDTSVILVKNLGKRGGRSESGHFSVVRLPHKNFDPVR